MSKPIHAKPSLYAYYFEGLKAIAIKYGYNLVLHGSLNRDLDLIAIPWQQALGDRDAMIDEFAEYLGGEVLLQDGQRSKHAFHGRIWYLIDINRGGYFGFGDNKEWVNDPQYYLDISVISPTL